jgi:hypothetical protein
MNVVSAIGFGSVPLAAWLPQLFPVALAVALIPLALGVVRHRRYVPLLLGLGACTLLGVTRAELLQPVWSIGAGLAFVAASLWNARPGRALRPRGPSRLP